MPAPVRAVPKRRARSRRVDAAPLVGLAVFAVALAAGILAFGVPGWVAAVMAALSILAFAVYWFDKRAAIAGRRRVPEVRLHVLGVLGGWPGAILAQQLFRHKTRKAEFVAVFRLTVVLNLLVVVAIALPQVREWFGDLVAAAAGF
ncbi:DUF1294 domain-containing protein [Agromyces seonyuensis]|uniref:DUF1294 domain-containing protein n=1 Tax=Agromyces seonyuensis TaxID=2662446 RepID=A0A6I4P4D5_9MICO|nr:DUF1294 domain-containing protein [Agromyces seonyuensis]MWB98144.1 DUF1294 domain-containing protein [Agromyces seonyuensis]